MKVIEKHHKKQAQSFPKTLGDFEIMLSKKDQKIKKLQSLVDSLQEELRLSKHRQFARKSEKEIEALQASLFDEAELPENKNEIITADEEVTVASFTRKKSGRKPLPKDLPREQVIHDLTEEEKHCACGCQLDLIGDERSEQLSIVPAKIYVIEHIYKKYACKGCEETVKQAKAPKRALPKSIASPGLAAYIATAKFEDHLPLYRQERMLQRYGIDIPRATLSYWMLKMGEALKPIYQQLAKHIIRYDVAFADETTLQVLNEPGRTPANKSYMWSFGGGPPEKQVWLYHYSPSRSHEVPDKFLEGFVGYLHTDGYKAYDTLAEKRNIKLVACWYHARRKFIEAEKVSKKAGLAKQAIRQIKLLSQLESYAKEKKLTVEKIKILRDEKARPLLNTFKDWLDEHSLKTPPQSAIGAAIKYTLNQWPKLLTYLDDGRLEISNNRSERAIKPFVIGRKNWLFNNSVKGADAAAVIYSLIETCKIHKIQPYDYLTFALENIPFAESDSELEKLLPFNTDLKRWV